MSVALWSLLVACVPPTPEAHPTVPPTPCTDCLVEGEQWLEVDGIERRVLTFLPEQVEGAPVLVVFHGYTVPPEPYLEVMPVHEATTDGFVVIVPESQGLEFEWDLESPPAQNADIQLVDRLIDIVVDAQGADAERVYATGFSAGGLMTAFVTMHRADRLAGTAPFSGGVFPIGAYTPTNGDVDVLVHWGGLLDRFSGYDFNRATLQLRDGLVADGQQVAMCNHHLGHRLPDDATERVRAWLRTHAQGAPELPAGCVRE
ncbi:MAG: hypothetical protein H6737_22850 [Alphaproteobacteria bacterium]|nr:hypothetical protein [Alphaproteobacteria bacterium]